MVASGRMDGAVQDTRTDDDPAIVATADAGGYSGLLPGWKERKKAGSLYPIAFSASRVISYQVLLVRPVSFQ
jgi:hypothetical protein